MLSQHDVGGIAYQVRRYASLLTVVCYTAGNCQRPRIAFGKRIASSKGYKPRELRLVRKCSMATYDIGSRRRARPASPGRRAQSTYK